MNLATRLRQGLPPLVAGLLLGWTGWVAGGRLQAPALEYVPQLVIRPSSAELVTTRGVSPKPDSAQKGRFSFEEGDFSVELRQEGWPPSQAEIEEPRGMTTVRAGLPRATLSLVVAGDKNLEARLKALPEGKKIKTAQGVARLDPGPHELLVEADGYLPKRLSVDLAPAERKEVVVSMEAIPMFPSFPHGGGRFDAPAGTVPPNLPTRPELPAPVYRPPAPAYRPPAAIDAARPAYRPPVSRPSAPPAARPAPAPAADPVPVPRFTPIAPPPQPQPGVPVPMFTPIRR